MSNPNPAFVQIVASAPQYAPPYSSRRTSIVADNNIEAGLVSAPVFGYYRFVGIPTPNINYPDADNTAVGR